jgi:hypothetical protein
MRSIPACVALLGLLAACRPDAPESAPPPAVHDSAGVAIVDAAGPRAPDAAAWRLADRPTLDLGGVAGDPALDLNGVSGALRLADGALVVANGGTGELRFFDARGRHLRTVGRRGSAPGEFESLGWLRHHGGDTVAVYDSRLQRVSLLTPSGALVRTQSVAPGGREGLARAVGLFPDGSALVTLAPFLSAADESTGVVRRPSPLLRVSVAGAVDSVGSSPGDELYLLRQSTGLSVTPLPFGRSVRTAVLADHFVTGDGATWELRVHAASGGVVRIIRRPGAAPPVRPEDIEAFVRASVGRVREPGAQASLERFWQTVPYPSTMPAFGALLPAADGSLWVEAPRPAGAPAVWSAISLDGRWLGRVELPQGFVPLDAGADYVLGMWKDPDEVEHVRMYALRR